MDLIRNLLKEEKKDCMCRGVFSFLFLGLMAILIYVIYRAVDVTCTCDLYCNCKGKCCGKEIDIEKDWSNKENEIGDQEF